MNSLREMSGVAARGRDNGLCEEWRILHDGGRRKAEQKHRISLVLSHQVPFTQLYDAIFLILVSPCLTAVAASSCHLRAIYVLIPIINVCHFLKTAQSYTLGKHFILIQDYFKCLPVCVPVLVHTSEPHQTAALASCKSLCLICSLLPTAASHHTSHEPLANSQAMPKLLFFFFHTWQFFFHEQNGRLFLQKKKLLWEVPFLERKQCF